MNAPLREQGLMAGTLKLFAAFHLNLAFSSIEEEQRGTVIAQCYWPLLQLAERHGPIGIEATGFTLEEIAARDPSWCAKARSLIAEGRIEWIGSGYAQIIGPLVPAPVTEANLRIGQAIYAELLGTKPGMALVNEQAYAAGLVPLYREAGYRGILMDWDNPAAHHPEWSADTRYRPQRARGSDGSEIGLLWTNTVAFQKMQRYVHGDIALEEYLAFVAGHRSAEQRALCLYASDAEIFDFRPGRYRTEENLAGESEWLRMGKAFEAIHRMDDVALVIPSDVVRSGGAGHPLRLESAGCPVPVKKQRKYNLSRWAVTGRDDIGVNAACERIYRGLLQAEADDAAWKELCYLWSSDFRTHITEKRWRGFCRRLADAEARWSAASHPARPEHGTTRDFQSVTERFLSIETPALRAVLDRRRGLAIRSLQFAGDQKALVGGLQHGHFDDIALQADWYTGDCVFEAPGEHKVTDLEWCEAALAQDETGDVIARAVIDTPKGPIRKTMRFHADRPCVDFDIVCDWRAWGRGSFRLGHITLLPDAFDWDNLSFTTHNGGRAAETFALAGTTIEHGAPVSFLVSASHGVGMTEGWVELGDKMSGIRVEIDRETSPLLGLLTHRRSGGSLFCQIVLSALELDETSRPDPYREGSRRFRFSLSRRPASVHC